MTTSSRKILIIDDQEMMLRILQSALKPLEAEFFFAKTGAQAIRHLEKSGLPDAIILDFSMPGEDGIETLKKIRALTPSQTVPVVMLTARDQTLIRQAAEGLLVHSFMTKPFSPSTLLKTLESILQ
jgi:CheY-like chemotaxis protein